MYHFDSRVRYSETDENGRLSLTGVLNYLQDCSTFQSEDLGIGIRYLTAHDRAWWVTSWQIAIDRYPVLGERIVISTWPYEFKGIYGYRNFAIQDPDGAYAAVIPKFIRQLLEGERPLIHGDGKQSRDFTYIENVIEANLKACLASHEAAGEVYNIAFGGREYLLDIYYSLAKTLGIKDSEGKVKEPAFGPERAGDIKHSNADISKARKLLGYDPEWSFEKGIKEAIDWYRENL